MALLQVKCQKNTVLLISILYLKFILINLINIKYIKFAKQDMPLFPPNRVEYI
jgi:hypothetical protein